jgi:O-antigen/teichoic acid export membrane protein
MTNISDNNKRIAKNTLLLYGRMAIMLVVGLFTSRVVLAALGIRDYGIYNVVGGVVSLFAVLTGAMSVTTSRFLTYALGEGDKRKLSVTFSTSVNIHILLGVGIAVLMEVLGVWFLNTHLNVPKERMWAANWVLQFSILTFVINLINVPYTSIIISHERMNIYAYLSLFDVFVKLGIVYALYVTPYDRLITYSIFLCASNLLVQILYYVYCKRSFEECTYHFIVDKPLLKEMFEFIGWTFWGNAAVTAKDQGVTILLNIFFGTTVNAAQGVATQVNGVVNRFIQNFMTAVDPQITKFYSMNDRDNMYKLIFRSAKFSAFLMLVLISPILMHVNSILGVWLVEVPEHAANFVCLVLIYSLIECMLNPLITALLASSKIKAYEILITITYSLNILSIYLLFKIGSFPEMAIILNIVFKLIVLGILSNQCKRNFSFPAQKYLKKVVGIAALISCLSFVMIVVYKNVVIKTTIPSFIVSCILMEMILLSFMYIFGMESNERIFIKNIINNKILKRK